MFLDYVKIFIKAGDGGSGAVSFLREKYVPNGGPDGGDGGNGGSVVFVADKDITTLAEFKFKKHFRAQNGMPGEGRNRTGKSGDDLVIKVPVGTVIKETSSGTVIADLFEDGERFARSREAEAARATRVSRTPADRLPAFRSSAKRPNSTR